MRCFGGENKKNYTVPGKMGYQENISTHNIHFRAEIKKKRSYKFRLGEKRGLIRSYGFS